MDDEDLDFDLDTPPKKPPARKGRRSDSLFGSSPPASNLSSPSSGTLSPSNTSGVPNPPPRSKKTGGWADDGSASSKRNWLRRSSKQSAITTDTPKKETTLDAFDSDNEIPVIPDLDDVLDEDFAAQIAEAPSVTVNRVATYQELDSDLLKHTAFASLDGIDLRLLTKRLASELEIKEDDVPWTWDVLFTDVASQLNTEMDDKKDKDVEIFT